MKKRNGHPLGCRRLRMTIDAMGVGSFEYEGVLRR